MRIAIDWNQTEAFWKHFEPLGFKLLCSRTPSYAMECIVDGPAELYEEVRKFPGVVQF